MLNKPFSRRRFISISAMTIGCAALNSAISIASTPTHHWQGILLGSEVKLTLAHPDRKEANRIFDLCVTEIKRLENILTLYDARSELSRLNKDGYLDNPSDDFIKILNLSQTYHTTTKGHFDITVKALEDGGNTSQLGMTDIVIDITRLSFAKSNMAITLNGIAQGYITDKVNALLKQQGLTNVLVELGEKQTIGGHPSGRPWQIMLKNSGEIAELTNMAMATSARLSPNSGEDHIYNPLDGTLAKTHQHISVIAKTATMADAYSTAMMSMSTGQIDQLKKTNSDIKKVYLA